MNSSGCQVTSKVGPDLLQTFKIIRPDVLTGELSWRVLFLSSVCFVAGNNSHPTAIACYVVLKEKRIARQEFRQFNFPYSEYKTLKNYL